ncbi:hypothetical protein ACFV4P_04580 [Kitasatospora sp. NPDC059795]|uniref:hypothetical protein n=1 Tax=Kitasatospora sp. NPDC059795 TaxID=3346949 RepID=UPI0036686D1E
MKRALALVAVTAAALFVAVAPASADTAPASADTSATQQLLSADRPATPLNGDTSWGGACETPHCSPWQ